jgi:hypothetical protein
MKEVATGAIRACQGLHCLLGCHSLQDHPSGTWVLSALMKPDRVTVTVALHDPRLLARSYHGYVEIDKSVIALHATSRTSSSRTLDA